MFIRLLVRAGLPGLAIALVSGGGSVAHEIVGNRFFPATIGIDDPGVNDELSFPTVSSFKTGDDPSFGNATFPANFPSGSPKRSRFRSVQPIAVSGHPEDRPGWEQTDFKILKPRSNTDCSRTRSTNL